METYDFARILLRALELGEASWNGVSYTRDNKQAAELAIAENAGVSKEWVPVFVYAMGHGDELVFWARNRLAKLVGKYEDQSNG